MKPTQLILLLTSFLLLATAPTGHAQLPGPDSLKRQLSRQPADTTRVRLLNKLARVYFQSKPDTAYQLAQQAYQLARRLHDRPGQTLSLLRMGAAVNSLGDQPKALQLYQQALRLDRESSAREYTSKILNNIAVIYTDQKDFQRSLSVFLETLPLLEQTTRRIHRYDTLQYAILYNNVGETYQKLDRLDSADYYSKRALSLAIKPAAQSVLSSVLDVLGNLEAQRGNLPSALNYYRQALANTRQQDESIVQADIQLHMARLYQTRGRTDSTLTYARHSLNNSQAAGYQTGILEASQFLTRFYEGRDDTRALRYYKVAVAARDSLFSQGKVRRLLTLDFEEQQRRQEIEATREAYQNRLRTYGLSGLIGVVLLIAGLLWRTNGRQRRSNQLLNRQKEEIDRQRSQAQQALTDLQATQDRLIQTEKMASLGELTAGIAHEIQNPLNFVNNFAEVSTELLTELADEQHKPIPDANLLTDLMADIRQNLHKIHHHGRRADAIVKGMLAHSSTKAGHKQATNLNALTEEYLRLAYHGLRAKDAGFNAELQTDFDAELGRVALVPQEMGRVLLNLFNNAFYAVHQKSRQLNLSLANVPEPDPNPYQPTVSVRTRRAGKQIEIRVTDNGTGIPEAVRQKIFQPFFTTKPTGEGTGLGLSLSYDIIAKGHGGTLSVESREDEGTRFIIRIPS